MKFDAEDFVTACLAARTDPDPANAVADVVAAVVIDGPSIDEALGIVVNPLQPDTLLSTPELTIQRIVFRGGARSGIHDHRMWAVVGVYAGTEVNRFFDRGPNSLVSRGGREIARGGVVTLDRDVIHEVDNPRREWTAGLHVYGGDILGVARSAWSFDDHEVPYGEQMAKRRVMFEAMWALAAEQGRTISDDDRLAALSTIWKACEVRRRCLTISETRAVVGRAWNQ